MRIFFAALLVFLSFVAEAGEAYRRYDSEGNYEGSVYRRDDGAYREYDAAGNYEGTTYPRENLYHRYGEGESKDSYSEQTED